MFAASFGIAQACTGIRLKSGDGAVLYGRTMEWGAFDLESMITVIPRGYEFTASVPDNKGGMKWKSKYGVVALSMLGQLCLADGVNEKGLAGGMFYHNGYADFQKFNPENRANTISSQDFLSYVLSNFETVEEVREGLAKVDVVDYETPYAQLAVNGHWMITDASGKSIVIEYLDGKRVVYDAPLGVITNDPTYDWHMTNLNNYINLSPLGVQKRQLTGDELKPLGIGSGMIGLPGDFTPPSRFVRAVAWTQTARPTPNGAETVYEMFRILDNFDVPLLPGEVKEIKGLKNYPMRSSTIWTSVWDLHNKIFYFTTQNNRRVRLFDIKAIDFGKLSEIKIYPMENKTRSQDYDVITPKDI